MSKLFTATFWKDAAERAVATGAQTLVPVLSADAASLISIGWPAALGVAGAAVLLSLAKSVVATGIGDPGTASLVRQDHVPHVDPPESERW